MTHLLLALSLCALDVAHAGFSDESVALGVATPSTKNGPAIWLDYDGDGWLDILATSSNPDHGLYLYRATGDGGFVEAWADLPSQLQGARDVRAAVAGDLDNDGDVDLVLSVASQAGPSEVEVWLNDGAGFSGGSSTGPALNLTNSNGYVFGLGLVDLNQDGWLDLIVGRMGSGLTPYLNAGRAALTLSEGPTNSGSFSEYLVVGDVNWDGNVDVVGRVSGGQDYWTGDGVGGFNSAGSQAFEFDAQSGYEGGVHLCDLDADGYLDGIRTQGGADFNRSYSSVEAFLFDVDAGDFVASGELGNDVGDLDGIACGDVDGDGDLDLYLAGLAGGLVTNGSDTEGFRLSGGMQSLTGGGVTERSAVFADYDHDGDLDLLVSRTAGGTSPGNALLVNDSGVEGLSVELEVDLGAWLYGDCDGETTRSDIGGWARLLDAETFAPITGRQELNGGKGYGAQAAPRLHFGVGGGVEGVKLEYQFAHPAAPDDYHLLVRAELLGERKALVLTTNDFDGDGISNADEGYGQGIDTDGDYYEDWEDLDADGDGVPDAVEAGDDDPCTQPVDSDLDGVGDWRDPDTQGPVDTGGDDTGGGGDSAPETGLDDTSAPTDDSAVPTDDSATPEPPAPKVALQGGLTGCGCASTGRAGAGGLLLLALLALSRRRR
ncbi:MAG: VCBS repeat-containing protein [Alphaproteobacteria bacterium]|nr:VCBS repeat-containing protein [Alphaproteobacteria bacterium]